MNLQLMQSHIQHLHPAEPACVDLLRDFHQPAEWPSVLYEQFVLLLATANALGVDLNAAIVDRLARLHCSEED